MSSYVIEKESYMKVAGIVAALQDRGNFHGNESGLYLYDLENGRLMTDPDIIRMFTEIYHLNALSVQKQYNDPTAEDDPGAYMDAFNEYRKIGKRAIRNTDELERLIYHLVKFSRSVNYQIEDERMNAAAMDKLNNIIVRAFSIVGERKHSQIGCWGKFEYMTAEEEQLEMERAAEANAIYYEAYCD